MILTDDNFGTLVHAVELGRTIYAKVVSYIRYQMTQLLALVLLFLAATAFDINDGVAMTPLMVLFLNFFIAVFPVIVTMLIPATEVMKRPPHDPSVPITNRAAIIRWVMPDRALLGHARASRVRARRLVHRPTQRLDDPCASSSSASAPCSAASSCATNPRAGSPLRALGRQGPGDPGRLVVLTTELDFLPHGLLTQSLTGLQWLACLGLALIVPVVVEIDKWIRRRQLPAPPASQTVDVVNPSRAITVSA